MREHLYDDVQLCDPKTLLPTGVWVKILKPEVNWRDHLTKEEQDHYDSLPAHEQLSICLTSDPLRDLERRVKYAKKHSQNRYK